MKIAEVVLFSIDKYTFLQQRVNMNEKYMTTLQVSKYSQLTSNHLSNSFKTSKSEAAMAILLKISPDAGLPLNLRGSTAPLAKVRLSLPSGH